MKINFLVLMIIVFSKEIHQFDNNCQRSKKINVNQIELKCLGQILQNFNHIEESVTLQYFTRLTIFKKQEHECKSEYDYRNFQIQDANLILKKSKLIYQQCFKKYSVNQIKGQILNQQKLNTEVFKNILLSISQQENELYNNKFRQFQVALQLIHALKRQINQINDTKQLITQVINFMQGILLSKITGNAGNQFNNLFQSLVEFCEQIDFDYTFEKSKVLNILNKLQSCIENLIDSLKLIYKQKCNDFATQQQRIDSMSINLQFRIDILEKNMKTASSCINSQLTIQNVASEKLMKNSLYLEKTKQFCQILEKQNDDAAAIKENLNKLTNQIQGIVKQNQIKK